MDSKVKLTPSKWLYLIGVLIIVVGIVVVSAMFAFDAMQVLGSRLTATVPGQTELNIKKVGTYAITYTYKQENGSETLITNYSDYSGLKFSLTEKSGNSSVTIKSVGNNVMEFSVSNPGTYTLNAAYDSGTGPSAVMTIVSWGQYSTIVIGIVVFLVCLVAGVLVIILTAVKRKKNRVGFTNR